MLEKSIAIESATVIDAVRRESVKDLKHTALWRPEYEFIQPDLVALPGVENMQVRIIGPNYDPKTNVIDTLLALTLYNTDLYLAERYECQNTSPFYPIGDLLKIKEKRFLEETGRSEKLWTLFEINKVPDFSKINLSQDNTKDILRISASNHAKDFRNWFHEKKDLNEKEMLQEYIALLKHVSWVEKLPIKSLRFVMATGLELAHPAIGLAASIFDTFVLNKLFRGKSPKFFIDDLTKITGSLS